MINTKSRYEHVLNEIYEAIYFDIFNGYTDVTEDEIEIVMNILKDNVPFDFEEMCNE